MTGTEEQASEAIERLSVNVSGPVSRPASEIVSYAHVLERILRSQWGYPVDALREYIAPHWCDVLIDMTI